MYFVCTVFSSVVFRICIDRGRFPIDFFVSIVDSGNADSSEKFSLRQRRFSTKYGKYDCKI